MSDFNPPETYDDLPDKRRYWPAAPGSREEGLGMLRLLTPEVVANAARTQIQTGERVCLNWDLEKLNPPGFNRKPFEHKVKWVAEGVAFDDEYHFNPQQSSQWDGLRHHNAPAPRDDGNTTTTTDGPDADADQQQQKQQQQQQEQLFYGGTTAAEILDPRSSRIGIGHWAKQGIAGRGVLIDYYTWAREQRGETINALSQTEISLDDVQTIARECGIRFQRGDILFLRVGLPATWDAMTEAQKAEYSRQPTPQHAGLEQSERVLRFLWDNHFAAVASDAVSFEVYPPRRPEFDLHHFLLAGWGVPIGEMFDLDELAAMCRRLGRWTFFVSSSPLNCAQGVSSPPNCMAIF
ncbi:uncharacterized protein BO97DRAFT_244290 [Aspergillus homomorphus CBS 101889]|uniref:Cyclase n=1 Tax=Aspergillus homomorphus (strain CBS 101889) TaxID=1450537 RepID=A0A395HMY1_ASPHC|nr:hypothetical protein BO97DRAFT_244290 [Aspergillus homomorphus CBS 101889]RAL07634.1 hypothetical protein BO97DRAFT_244290 [Aspergillus homomorphus CBS 101889]